MSGGQGFLSYEEPREIMKKNIVLTYIAVSLLAIGIVLSVIDCGVSSRKGDNEWVFMHPKSLQLRDSLQLIVELASGAVWYDPGDSSGSRTISADVALQLRISNRSRTAVQIPYLEPCPETDTVGQEFQLALVAGDEEGRIRLNTRTCLVALHPDSLLIVIEPETVFCRADQYDLATYLQHIQVAGDSIWLQMGLRNFSWRDTLPPVWLGEVWSDSIWLPIVERPATATPIRDH